eukprot:15445362-Alexandrium_andersonii.AAC.1
MLHAARWGWQNLYWPAYHRRQAARRPVATTLLEALACTVPPLAWRPHAHSQNRSMSHVLCKFMSYALVEA